MMSVIGRCSGITRGDETDTGPTNERDHPYMQLNSMDTNGTHQLHGEEPHAERITW